MSKDLPTSKLTTLTSNLLTKKNLQAFEQELSCNIKFTNLINKEIGFEDLKLAFVYASQAF